MLHFVISLELHRRFFVVGVQVLDFCVIVFFELLGFVVVALDKVADDIAVFFEKPIILLIY